MTAPTIMMSAMEVFLSSVIPTAVLDGLISLIQLSFVSAGVLAGLIHEVTSFEMNVAVERGRFKGIVREPWMLGGAAAL